MLTDIEMHQTATGNQMTGIAHHLVRVKNSQKSLWKKPRAFLLHNRLVNPFLVSFSKVTNLKN